MTGTRARPSEHSSQEDLHPALMKQPTIVYDEPVLTMRETHEMAISNDMNWLGLWGNDVNVIPGIKARYSSPFAKPSTPGHGIRLLFCTAWEDRAKRQVWVAFSAAHLPPPTAVSLGPLAAGSTSGGCGYPTVVNGSWLGAMPPLNQVREELTQGVWWTGKTFIPRRLAHVGWLRTAVISLRLMSSEETAVVSRGA